ncbi:unnamed protein product [Gongylonema pulchrum]|uniref:39S ribosomal protein L50, mitochondrial n=1 Tax=Gongylonema pulchrum TaxID=637853 RepID=A0A183F1P3_9BILA|nr:unnamed protein product [Gongylonema pulchrum]
MVNSLNGMSRSSTRIKYSEQPGRSGAEQLLSIFKKLTTPTEQNWPGVTRLPRYRTDFPQWTSSTIESDLKDFLDADGLRILQQMLVYHPAQRISAKALLKDDYFNDVDRSNFPRLSSRRRFKEEVPHRSTTFMRFKHYPRFRL